MSPLQWVASALAAVDTCSLPRLTYPRTGRGLVRAVGEGNSDKAGAVRLISCASDFTSAAVAFHSVKHWQWVLSLACVPLSRSQATRSAWSATA